MIESGAPWKDLSVGPPTPTGESQPFWDAVADGRLLLQSCAQCSTVQGYPRRRCVQCWSDDLHWVESRGEGVVVTFTEVHRPGQAAWAEVAPYVVGLVRLEEGCTMLTHLLAGGGDLHVGDEVHFTPTQVGGWVLPFFRAVSRERSGSHQTT
ncbi:MAG: hypothetical protein EON52_06235 [Actinomycetales bacterium]|nr:MAG: hypothetical protein EON52_06235 [Actinomycetales bacterium]